MNSENKIRHKEYIKNLGYTIQNELGDHEGSITYFVEQGNQYVIQVVTLFNDAGHIEKMRESVELLERMTEVQPGLFLRYYEHDWLDSASEFEIELLAKIEYGYSLERYLSTHHLSLKDVLMIGIQIAEASIVCREYHVDSFVINEKNVFYQKNIGWRLGNFNLSLQQEKHTAGNTDCYGMSPEWYQGEECDESGSIYQLGLLLYRLMNELEMPFSDISQNEHEAEMLRRTGKEPPLPLYGCDSLKRIVRRACSSRDKRYSDMAQLKTKLEYILKRLPGEWLEAEVTGHSYKDEDYIDSNYAEVQDTVKKQSEEHDNAEDGGQEEERKRLEKEKEEERKRLEKEKKKEQKSREQAERERKKQQAKEEKKRKREKTVVENQSDEELNRKFGKQNRKDLFAILGIVCIFIAVVVIIVYTAGNSTNHKIYSYINSAAYGSAAKEMKKLYEKGENLDDIAEAYLDACMNDREYKRIPEGVAMLSEAYCEQHEEKFETMITEMVENRKEKQAADLLNRMENMGGSRAGYALKLKNIITENK